MATTTGYIDFTEQTTPSNPSAGHQRVFVDSSAHAAKIVNSSGTVSALGGTTRPLVFLEAHTASSSATLDFTTFISSTYDEYMIEGVGLAPATNAVNMLMRVGTGGGPTYDSGSNYYNTMRAGTGAVNTGTGAANQGSSNGNTTNVDAPGTSIMIAKSIANNAGYGLVSFQLRLTQPQNTSNHKHIYGTSVWHNGTEVFMVMTGSLYAATTALTAVRFLMSSGNIASGDIRIYGYTKS